MTSTHPNGSSRRILASFLVLSICAAALATAVPAPAAASANLAVAQPNEWQINESEWFINDAPTLHGRSWWGGNLANDMNRYGQPYGHGPARHNGSSYAYVSEETGDPADHWARWDMETREGTQELAVFIPRADASAAVRYRITSGSRSAYTDRITQQDIYGWHSLGTVTANGDRVRIDVHYNDSQTAPGLSGPAARRVGVDAMAMRCVSNCSEKPLPPPGSVRAAPHGEKSLRVTWSAPANTSGSPIRGYAVQFSRGALNNHPLHGDRDPWSSSRIAVNGTTHTSGRLLQGVTYKVAVWTVNQNGQRSQSASTTNATTNAPETTGPPPPRSVRAAPHGEKSLRVTWSAPANTSGSPIRGYAVQFSRGALNNHPLHGDRDPWSSSRIAVNGTTHTSGRLLQGVTYKVAVWTVNQNGQRSQSASTTNATTNAPETTGPPPPRSVRAAPHGEKSLRVTWSAPANTSGSPIRGYAVQFSRGALNNHPLHGDRDPWSSSRIAVNGTTHTSGRLLQGVTYKVAVWTVNQNGQRSQSASTTNATTNAPGNNVCSGGAKYTIEESGVWPFRTKRVETLRSFKTVTNSSITRGQEGGKINNASSLSQSGCSWIFPHATVEDNAMVSDNAVIANSAKISDDARVYGNAAVRIRASIRDNARIYGNATIRDDAEIRNSAKIFGNAVVEDEGRAWDTAQVSANARVSDKSEVYGDAEVNGKARVYGDADVYGNAHVFGNARIIGDAHVYGNAKVYGDAEVYGKARVYGNAEVYGHAKILGDAHVFGKAIVKGNAVLSDGMKADSGVFDGRAEYIRAAKEIYSAIYQTLVSDLEECLNDRELAENTAKALLDPNAQDWERQFAEGLNYGCARLRAYGKIVQVLTPGTAEMILQFGIPLVRTLRLGTYAKSLLDILSAVKDIRDLSKVSSTAEEAIKDVSRALEEIGPM